MLPVVGLEIGTTKVVALTGEMLEDERIVLTGKGEHISVGLRKGEVVDLEKAAGCAKKALKEAADEGAVEVGEIVVAISGGHIRGQVYSGHTSIQGAEGLVSEDDIEDVEMNAESVSLPGDREMIHTIKQRYRVDDHERVVNPLNMAGSQLSLNILGIHGSRTHLRNLDRLAACFQTEVQDVVFGGLASALAVLTVEQKRSGVAVIDLGAGTTDYIAYADGVMACGGSLGLGGDHVTNDLVIAFNIAQKRAEALKCKHGMAIVESSASPEKIALPAELGFPARTVNLRSLNTVINARIDETLQKVKSRLEKEGLLARLGGGVILTGGGARMSGVQRLAESVFEVPCRIGNPGANVLQGTAVEGPEYATCCGLLQYALRMQKMNESEGRGSLFGQMFRGLFRGGVR